MSELLSKAMRATDICKSAGDLALSYFSNRETLAVDQKGHQDWVSEADKNVEWHIRKELSQAWPDDGVVGEEYPPAAGKSGFRWVIDPIDGTTNFINGIPAWTVVLAGVAQGETRIGIIHDPCSGETYVAVRGEGAKLNGSPLRVARDVGLKNGTVAVGYSNRVPATNITTTIGALIESGAMFHRNASGALSLAYVAAGRFLGYIEEHMNAWDCLAGQLLVEEAGGRVEEQDADRMIDEGGRVIVGTPEVFDELRGLVERCWPSDK